MNDKGVGAIFCMIAAILMSARYLSAAVFMSGVTSWDKALFEAGLAYVGQPLKICAILALAAGLVFLALGIWKDRKDAGK